jgi:hypothetical protein
MLAVAKETCSDTTKIRQAVTGPHILCDSDCYEHVYEALLAHVTLL